VVDCLEKTAYKEPYNGSNDHVK